MTQRREFLKFLAASPLLTNYSAFAQEVEEILPSAVTERETSLDSNIEGAYKTVAYDQLSSLFIESIKELRKENQELRQMIEELGNK